MERAVLTFLRAARSEAYQFHAISLGAQGALEAPFRELGIPIVEMRLRSWNLPAVLWRLGRYLSRHNIDLVHSHGYQPDLVARLAARIAGLPQVSTLHTCSSWKRRPRNMTDWFRKRVDSWTGKHLATHCVALSDAIKQFHVSTMGYHPEAFTIIPNPVDLSRLDLERVARDSSREHLGVSDDVVLVVSVGNLLPVKGHRFLIEAASQLKDCLPHSRYFVLGEGRCREELEQQIEEHRLEIVFSLPGFCENIGDYLTAADILVMPSLSEGQSLAILEGMTKGLALLVTSEGAHMDYLIHGQNALVVDPGDPAQLADALRSLIGDRQLRERLGNSALATLADLDVGSSVERQLQFYRSIISQGS